MMTRFNSYYDIIKNTVNQFKQKIECMEQAHLDEYSYCKYKHRNRLKKT